MKGMVKMNFYDDLVMQTQMNYLRHYLSMLPAVRLIS